MPPRTTASSSRSRTAAPPAATNASIRAVVGSDESEVKRLAREYAAAMAPADAGEMGCEIIDGAADNADGAITRIHQTIQALQTFPFFGGEKLVWLKNANFLGDTVTGRAESVIEAAAALLDTLREPLAPGVRFLLSAPEIDKRRSFYKTLGKVAALEVHDKADTSRAGWENAAAGSVRERANTLGLQLHGDVLELFVLLTGGDNRQIRNELEKLDLYLGDTRREVTPEDLRLLVASSRASVIFELGNALVARDLNTALGLLEKFLFHGESPVGILLVAIIPTVRNLLLAKDLLTRHRLSRPTAPFQMAKMLERLPPAATAHLPRKKDGTLNTYSLGLAAMGAHRFETKELLEALEACLEANTTLVTSGLDARTVLSQLIIRIATPRK